MSERKMLDRDLFISNPEDYEAFVVILASMPTAKKILEGELELYPGSLFDRDVGETLEKMGRLAVFNSSLIKLAEARLKQRPGGELMRLHKAIVDACTSKKNNGALATHGAGLAG